jgi:hypothetical protein
MNSLHNYAHFLANLRLTKEKVENGKSAHIAMFFNKLKKDIHWLEQLSKSCGL